MSKEPELSIKVSVDPVIDGEHLGIDIQNQIDKLNNLPKVKIDPDTKNFGKDLSKQISQNLRAVNRVLKTQLDRMSTNINSLNQVSQELFSGTDFSSNIQSQAEIVSSSLKNIEDHISTLSSMFEASHSTKLKLSGSFSSIEELDNLIVSVKNNLLSLFNDGPLNDDNEFSKTFTAALPSIKKLRDIIFDIEEISDNKTVLKKLGIDGKSLVNSRNNLELLSSLLDTIIDYNDTGDIGGIFDELKSTENISKYFSVALSSLKELDTTLDNTSKKTTNIKKATKIFDRSQLDEISNAYSEALGNLISKQNALNRSKESTINLEDQLLQKTTETTAKIGEQVQNLKSLFSEIASSDIGKQLPAVSEYMKSKAELEASKNIENAKSLSLNVNSSSAKEYEAALKGIKDRVSELSKENAFSNLNSNIAENARAFDEAKAPVKDYVAALDDANRKSREARLPQQRTTGLNVSNIENYSQKVTAIKNDLYALKDTVFPAVYSDINRTYGHLFDDSIANVQSYIDNLNEIPAAASSKVPANRAQAKTQHSKKAETIDSTNIKNYAALLNGIQGAMNDMKTTIVPDFNKVLSENGKRIADIGASLVNYVAVLKRGLKAVDQSEKTMADKTVAKPVAVPTKKNVKDDVKKPEVIDLKGKVELNDEDIKRPDPLKLNGSVKIKASDVKIDDIEISKKEFDIKGNLILKNAEIVNAVKEATKKAEKEVSEESEKTSKKGAEKEKQRKKKEYLLALGSLLKKNANAQNELSDMYPGAPDYEELQNYIGKLHRRTGTTVDLLDTLVGRDGWKNDVLYTSAVEDSMHIRSRKKAGAKTSETLKAGIAEEKEYVSILEKIPDLEKSATKALTDFGVKSAHYQDANKKLTNAKDTVEAFEQKYGEAYSDLLRSEVIEQQNLSKAMAQEKAIRDAQLAQEEEANKKRIADEKKYLSLLTQETKDHQTALEAQREYGDKDFHTQYAMEDWQKSNTDLKTLEATVKKQSGSLSNVPGYNEIVEKNRRSWMQWGQDQQDISAKQRAADLKNCISLLNNYNKALETQAKLLQGLYKIDRSKDPGGYAAKQIALQSNAINVANLRKDIKSRGLDGESTYTDANAKYLAGINAANLTKAQKAKEATDKAATNAKKKQDEWVKNTESIISEAEKKYTDAFKAIQKEQADLSKTSDQQTKNDINSRIVQKQAEMDDAKKVLDSYNSTANGLVQEAWGRIDYQTKGSEIQDQIAYEAKSGKEAAATKKENLAILKEYNQSLNEELKLLKQIYVAETAEDKVAAQNALNDQKDKTDRLRDQLKGKGLDTTSDYQKYNTQNALNKAAINAKYNGTSIEDLKNTYIKNLREREANINAAYSTEDADKIARITQRIEDNNKAIQEAGFALTQFGQKANDAWAEISKVNDELDIAAEQKFNKALEAQTKQADTQAKKAISDNEKLLNRIERAMRNQEKAYSDYQSSEDNTQDKETKLGRLNIRNEELKGLRQQAGTRGLTVTQEYLTLEKQHREEILGIDEALQKRAQAEQEAIRVQDKDRLSLLAYIKTIEKYKDTLEKDNKTDSAVYGKSVGMSNAGWDLLNELNRNPDNKDQVANLWGQKYNLQGVTDLESAFKALAIEAAKAGIEVQDLRTETEKFRAITQAKTNIANIQSQLMDYLEKFPKVEKVLAEPVQKLKAALADPNAYKDAGRLKQAMAELRAQAKSLGLESGNLIDKFQKLFGQHLSTMITMAALHKMQEALRIVYQNVVEIDTAVTELRKVSEYAGKSLEEYMGRAAEQAQKLGVSISNYINSTADWKRLGYSDEDAENMATYSTLLHNVGDGIDDVNTSSSYLISTLQGFGLLAKDAENVVDQIDKVANTQPITAQAIGEILTRSAASMKAANNDLAETISLGTAAYAVIQNAETVGTTLKSVSMYLRAAKSDLESAGESADGCANSVSELRSELKSLTGVDIMIDNKNFKSTYQILKELSQVWDKLSDVTQANVTEMIGGKRNANAVSAILNNFNVAESAMESAANSAGTAWEENSVWLDSIQGRLGQLDASFQVLSQDVLSSDLVKTGVSFLTSIVKLLDKFINLTGALPAGLGITAFVAQLGKPKMTGFTIVPSNTPGGNTEQVLHRYLLYHCEA
nr:MAG TPA: minor tail protein [Caudoviricetes sp.]